MCFISLFLCCFYTMSNNELGGAACHNCRRERRKCDRSLPGCLKCGQRNQQCLGYGRLFRWETGIASRGKMAGTTHGQVDLCVNQQKSCIWPGGSGDTGSDRSLHGYEKAPLCPKMSPFDQDLRQSSRFYLSYCMYQ